MMERHCNKYSTRCIKYYDADDDENFAQGARAKGKNHLSIIYQ